MILLLPTNITSGFSCIFEFAYSTIYPLSEMRDRTICAVYISRYVSTHSIFKAAYYLSRSRIYFFNKQNANLQLQKFRVPFPPLESNPMSQVQSIQLLYMSRYISTRSIFQSSRSLHLLFRRPYFLFHASEKHTSTFKTSPFT
jgi:hypothetical protein